MPVQRHWPTLCATLTVFTASGCGKCAEPIGGVNHNEPTTNVRGVVVSKDQSAQGSRSPLGRFHNVLIQPLRGGDPTPRNEAYVHALYIQTPYDVGVIGKTLTTAMPGPSSTCPPRWRIDVYTPHRNMTAYVNESCGLLKIGDRFGLYTDAVRRTLGAYFRRALRKPTHRIIRIRTAAELDPRKVLHALRSRALRAYLPHGPHARNPYVRVAARLSAPLPADLTRLDEAAEELRRRALDMMQQYGQALLDSRPEVAGFEGPYPVAEAFERDLRVNYEIKVYFRMGTDPLAMRYQVSRLEMHIAEVAVPKFYRVDAVLPGKMKLRAIRKMLAKMPFKPPLILWPMLTRP